MTVNVIVYCATLIIISFYRNVLVTVSAFLSHQPRKRFGQNFLHDQVIIGRIIDSIHAGRDDLMVEIGPGMGAITEPLLKEVNRLTVVELDTDLADSLRIRIGANSNDGLTIVKANAMEVDYRALFQQIIGDNPNDSTDKKCALSVTCHTIFLRRYCFIY